jgi:hypothetical protein
LRKEESVCPRAFYLTKDIRKSCSDHLLNVTRIIRVDNNRNIEISHDRLISPILKSKQQREKEEEKLREIQQLQKLEEERAQKSRELSEGGQ